MRGRIISTLLLWSTLIFILAFFKAPGAIWLTAVAAAVTQYELYGMFHKLGSRPLTRVGVGFGLLISLSPFYLPEGAPRGAEFFALSIVICSIITLLRKPRGNAVAALSTTLLGLLLIPYTLLFISLLVDRFSDLPPQGLMMGVWLVAATKFTDAGALLVGMKFGKHKMAPGLSPKKTWEGAIGGVLVSSLVSFILVASFRDLFPADFHPWIAAAISPPVAIAAIYADLLESAIKRESGVKDSGKLFPGIGGVFDLTDSFMFSAPTAYFLVVAVLG